MRDIKTGVLYCEQTVDFIGAVGVIEFEHLDVRIVFIEKGRSIGRYSGGSFYGPLIKKYNKLGLIEDATFGRKTTQDCMIITTIKKGDIGNDYMLIRKYDKNGFANFSPDKLLNKLTDEHINLMNKAVLRRAFERGRVNLFLLLPV